MMYHDARTLETRSAIKAYAIYHALPEYYEDVKDRRNDTEEVAVERAKWISLISVVQYLVIHIFLVKSMFTLSAPLWADFLLFAGPMLIMMGIWWRCNQFWTKTVNFLSFEIKMYFVIALIACSVFALIIDPFIYPEMPAVLKILISIGGNGILNMLAIMVFWRVMRLQHGVDELDNFIDPFGEI